MDTTKYNKTTRKTLRKIYDPLQLDGGVCRIRFNCELKEYVGGLNVDRFVKSQRIRWLTELQNAFQRLKHNKATRLYRIQREFNNYLNTKHL